MHVIAGSRRLEVTGGGAGIVVHAGLVLLRQLADRTGLTGGLSRALVSGRLLVHFRAGGVGADGVAGAGRDRFGRGEDSPQGRGGGERGAAAGVGGDRGPARRPAGRAGGGPGAGRGACIRLDAFGSSQSS